MQRFEDIPGQSRQTRWRHQKSNRSYTRSMFVPGVTTEATHGLLFVIGRNASLCVIRTDTVQVPTGEARDALYLGELDGTACFARWLGEDPIPDDCEVTPLRQLFGTLT